MPHLSASAFSFADRIKTPLLLVHGDADSVAGTSPLQSELLFEAIESQGGTVRYVSLPYDDHSYEGRENLLHLYWEMNRWLDRYVKSAR